MSSNDFNISVIIPFYKADEFFDECIESVLGVLGIFPSKVT